MADGYNGWTNYETWNINLWIDNEEPLYRDKMRFIRSTALTAKRVEAYCREVYPEGTPDMDPGDMDKVDWEELTEAWERESES